LVEVFPGVEAGVVAIIEDELHGVLAYRLDRAHADRLFAEYQGLLARAVPFDLGRRGMDAQVLERQLEAAAILEGDFQQARCAAQLDFDGLRVCGCHGGLGVGSRLHYYGRPCSSSGTSWNPQIPPTPTTSTVWSTASGLARPIPMSLSTSG